MLIFVEIKPDDLFVLDVHRVLRWRGPRLDHRGPRQGLDGEADRLCHTSNVRWTVVSAQEPRHPQGS